jgi:transaldolase
VTNYEQFARELLEIVHDRPVSFEVFTDDRAEMERQARVISSWGEHVYVKLPVTDTEGVGTEDVLRRVHSAGVKVNVTGLMTLAQVERIVPAINGEPSAYVSVFAGRIADAGIDPIPIMRGALEVLSAAPNVELLWASPREILNVVQADEIGCHVITVTHDLLKKLPLLGRDLTMFSLETVRMFHDDARAAGYAL